MYLLRNKVVQKYILSIVNWKRLGVNVNALAYIIIIIIIMQSRYTKLYRHGGLVVKASASLAGGHGFDPWPSHT